MADDPDIPGEFETEEVFEGEPEEIFEEDDSENHTSARASSETRINDALQSLPLFEDLFLRMQALNLDIVDGYIEEVEGQLLREYMEIEQHL